MCHSGSSACDVWGRPPRETRKSGRRANLTGASPNTAAAFPEFIAYPVVKTAQCHWVINPDKVWLGMFLMTLNLIRDAKETPFLVEKSFVENSFLKSMNYRYRRRIDIDWMIHYFSLGLRLRVTSLNYCFLLISLVPCQSLINAVWFLGAMKCLSKELECVWCLVPHHMSRLTRSLPLLLYCPLPHKAIGIGRQPNRMRSPASTQVLPGARAWRSALGPPRQQQ